MPTNPRSNEIDISQNSSIDADLQSIIDAIADVATQATIDAINAKLPALILDRIPVDVASLNVSVDNAQLEIANDTGNPIPVNGTVSIGSTVSVFNAEAIAANTITVVDTTSTTTTLPSGQEIITGSATVGSSAVNNQASAHAGASFLITGTWVGTLKFEASNDNINFFPITAKLVGKEEYTQSTSGNGLFRVNCNALQAVRVRASAFTSGTANVRIVMTKTSGYVELASLPLGQQSSVRSVPVTVASNQSKYPVWLEYQPIRKTPVRRTDGVNTSDGLYFPLIVCRLKTGATKLVYPDSMSFVGAGREHELAVFVDDNTVLTTGAFAAPTNVLSSTTDVERNITISSSYTPSGNARCIYTAIARRDTTFMFNINKEMRVPEDGLLTTGKHLIFAAKPLGGNGSFVGASLNLIEI